MKAKFLLIVSFPIMFFSCMNRGEKITVTNEKPFQYTQFVNAFIGTDGVGNIVPAACIPFGMVQLGPDTRMESFVGSGGYHHSDNKIIGFTHTHISGVGVASWSDLLFMSTTGNINVKRGSESDLNEGYQSGFSKKNESAKPGFYSVLLDKYNVRVELTATPRTGFHKYIFPKSDKANIIIDLTHREKVRESFIRIISNKEIEGYRRVLGMADDKYIYFVAQFSKPFETTGIFLNDTLINSMETKGENVKAFVSYATKEKEEILMKVGISSVGMNEARKNLATENPEWNFEKVRQEANDLWNKELGKIKVEGGTQDQTVIFYSALYHSLLSPQLFNDVDGKYFGADRKIHQDKKFNYYTVYSLWDTYRSSHPLFAIIDPKRNIDFIKSLLAKYEQDGFLPEWELGSHDWGGMIAYPAVPVIVDAYKKGLKDFDIDLAYKAIKYSATRNKDGLNYYKSLGFVPQDKIEQSVSKTLEYAYQDWVIASMAKDLGKTEDYNYFMARSKFYKNHFDSLTNTMRPRLMNGTWLKDYTPEKLTFDYTESNATQYTPFVPHDMKGLIELYGGKEKFGLWLDNKFFAPRAENPLGFYEQGNEPTQHVAYDYNYIGKAWKTQELVRKIIETQYSNAPLGLPGNDDCGQMSAWLVFNMMGFYPFNPGQPIYLISSPIFKKVTIELGDGKKFIVEGKNNSKENKFIQSSTLNGKAYTKSYFTHSDLVNGGILSFEMDSKPNLSWAKDEADIPPTPDSGFPKQSRVAFIEAKEPYFLNETSFKLNTDTKGGQIYYTLDGSEPDKTKSIVYTMPITINQTTIVKAKVFREDYLPSVTTSVKFQKAEFLEAIKLDKPMKNGLSYQYYEVSIDTVPDFSNLTPVKSGITNTFDLSKSLSEDYYAFQFNGFLKIERDGIFTFKLGSDDGSKLYIDDKLIVEHNGGHAFTFIKEKQALKKGYHKIKVEYFEVLGGQDLQVQYEGPGIRMQKIPDKNLFIYK